MSTSDGSVSKEYLIQTISPGDKHHLVGTIGGAKAVVLAGTPNGPVMIR